MQGGNPGPSFPHAIKYRVQSPYLGQFASCNKAHPPLLGIDAYSTGRSIWVSRGSQVQLWTLWEYRLSVRGTHIQHYCLSSGWEAKSGADNHDPHTIHVFCFSAKLIVLGWLDPMEGKVHVLSAANPDLIPGISLGLPPQASQE